MAQATHKEPTIHAGRAFFAAASIGLLALTACGSVDNSDTATQNSSKYLDELSKTWAGYYQVSSPPDVQTVRFIGTEEVDSVHRQCLLESGYERDSLGLISVPKGQESVFAVAEYTCRMQYPVTEEYTKEWSDEQVRVQYAWTTQFVVPCLEKAGHPIAEVPSESVFVETWETRPFYPFAQVKLDVPAQQYNDAWAALEEQCPQVAPGEVVWDGVSIDDWARQRG